MTKRDFEWLAEVTAAMRARGRLSSDGLAYLAERLSIRYPKFNVVIFDKVHRRHMGIYVTDMTELLSAEKTSSLVRQETK